MNNYLILSHKSWNASLPNMMKSLFPNDTWSFINDKNDFNYELVKEINPQYIFIPHWSYYIPEQIYSNFECIVFHMTDLPFGRGGSPLQNLIARDIETTKISAIKVTEEIDAGDIYLKKDLNLNGTAEEVFLRANKVVAIAITEIIEKGMQPVPQEGESTLFVRRTPEMSNIATDQIIDLESLFDHIRMLDAEGYPHAYLETNHFKIEFTRASLKANQSIIADVRITKK
ncbi:methionyl-tRNA formyltransferase [Winogradskyella sp.]|jgi:methionyl-tRNA formyltransferase|uniref:methionyl-tRNA formyltransferase n=1 Tax=Winogradskyella sp. TaxID=1883156 RepID=UPI0025FC7C0E|nr:methionyl-tRNA formyltransferase [Winogradskyella sp.]MCT4628553.1 methionyl-tRNA formyltransferase [Winogradskyella sp.]